MCMIKYKMIYQEHYNHYYYCYYYLLILKGIRILNHSTIFNIFNESFNTLYMHINY